MPSNSAVVEQLRWKKFPVLDDGFVCLVDVMGDDQAIVQAARVSYGEGTRRVSDDRTLIRYLMRHHHTTPLEMAEVKILVRVPMDTWRQWIRHRTACLAGDSVLSFDLPGAERQGRRRHHPVSIEEFYRLWHEGTQSTFSPKKKPTFVERVEADRRYTVPELSRLVKRRAEDLRNMVRWGVLEAEREDGRIFIVGHQYHAWAAQTTTKKLSVRDRLAKMKLRMCDEQTGEITHTQVTDIWQSGVKPVFRVTLKNGYQLKMSEDHLCLTESGWKTLKAATSLRLREDGGCTWDGNAPAFAVNGVLAHHDQAWLADKRHQGWSVSRIADAAGVSYHTIRKALQKHGLQYTNREKAKLSGASQRGQRRTMTRSRPQGADWLNRVREARSGPNSNFWKGGVSTERERIGRWTTDHAQQIHRSNGFRCVLCGSKTELETHHVDPVWNNSARAYDLDNLTSLCADCHSRLHAGNLELAFLAAWEQEDLARFWQQHNRNQERPAAKRKPAVRRLVRTWSKIARIEYVGEEMTYDLSVAGPYHNFVANGFIVHNSVNEYSTRYSIAIDASQTTTPDAWRLQATSNRQGSEGLVDVKTGEELSAQEAEFQKRAREMYQQRLERGVAREQARKDLPLSTYTEAYWKMDLHNLLHFLYLRMDSHAQWEIQQYARTIGEQIVRPLFPIVWEAFADYRLEGMHLTRLEQGVIARLAAAGKLPASDADFLAAQDPTWTQLERCRERDECRTKLVRLGLLSEKAEGGRRKAE